MSPLPSGNAWLRYWYVVWFMVLLQWHCLSLVVIMVLIICYGQYACSAFWYLIIVVIVILAISKWIEIKEWICALSNELNYYLNVMHSYPCPRVLSGLLLSGNCVVLILYIWLKELSCPACAISWGHCSDINISGFVWVFVLFVIIHWLTVQ